MDTSSRLEDEKIELPEVPDGGLRAWFTIAGSWLSLFATFGYVNAFGVYQDYYTRVHHASPSSVSWIGAVQLCLLSSVGLPAGKLLDKGYFRHVTIAGSCIFIFSLFMLSLANPDRYYQIFLSQGVGMGIGAGLLYLPANAVQAHHWRKRRAMAMGLVITGSSFGGIVYPIMLNRLFNGSVGFAWGVRASAFLTLGILIIANCLMSTRLPPSGSRAPRPKIKLSHILTDTPYMITIAGYWLVYWGLFFPYFYLQLFAVLRGLPTQLAFYCLTIQNAASIPGRTLPNALADKMGVLNVYMVTSFASGALVFALFGITGTAGVIVFAILYGFFSGACLSLFAPTLASFSHDVSEVGLRMGIAFFFVSFAYLTGPPINGSLLGSSLSWFKPITFSGTIILVAIPLIVVARSIQAKRKHTFRV